MSPAEFVQACAREKDELLRVYLDPLSGSQVAESLARLALPAADRLILVAAVDGILRETFYRFLLALDGAAALGGTQGMYSLRDASGMELTGGLEGLAWEQFHGGTGAKGA
jgi:hypothetical protein